MLETKTPQDYSGKTKVDVGPLMLNPMVRNRLCRKAALLEGPVQAAGPAPQLFSSHSNNLRCATYWDASRHFGSLPAPSLPSNFILSSRVFPLLPELE